ncbi:MAG: DUF3225 domain-containing protein [Gemmatimonadota bacterium]|jgi:hypothetical protein
MRIGKRWAVVLSVLALTGCAAPTSDATEIDQQAVAGEIREFADAFWEAWRDGDSGLDRAMAFFEDHADFAYAAQGTVWRSLSEVTETFRMAFEVVEAQNIEIQETVITVLGQDLAYLVQSGAYSMTDTDGVASETRTFVFSGLLMRTASGWRVRSAHVSEPCVG